MTHPYLLYGAEISYFTGKARAYLRFKGIPFEERPATREVYKEIIVPRVGWPVIPVVVTPEGETLQDTSDIIDALEQRFPECPVFPASPGQRTLALLMEVYGDEWLKLPAMHYRWNHNTDWIIREFGRLSRPDLDEAGQREVGERSCRPFRGSLPILGVTEQTAPAIEHSYRGLLAELDAHFAKHEFLFGSRPSIGDFSLYGPLYAHQFRDPASGALMRELAPSVVGWVERMTAPNPNSGEFLADDGIPPTLMPVFERMIREQAPVIDSTLTALADWIDGHPGEKPPRAIGTHAFTLQAEDGTPVRGERGIFPFDQWMFQRPLDCFQALDETDRDAVRSLLTQAGRRDLLDRKLKHRVARQNFELVVAA